MLVVRENGGYGGNNDRYLDLRVDDDPEPIERLKKLVELHHLYFGQVDPKEALPLAELASELQEMLQRTGQYNGPINGVFTEETRKALRSLAGSEHLEERWDGESDQIDGKVIQYLREEFNQ